MRKVVTGLERNDEPRTGRSALLLAALLAGACGGATATGEPAAEPEGLGPPEPAPTDGSATAEPVEPVPHVDDSSSPTSGADAPLPRAPQQAAQAASPPPEPVVEEPPAAPPPPPGNGRLVIGRAEVARGGGRVNGNLFARAVERKRGGMLACYNVPLGADPVLRGSLVMVLVVDPQGMVGVRVEEDDEALAEAGVTNCVIQKLRQVSFSDTPPGSELWVRVPLEFKP